MVQARGAAAPTHLFILLLMALQAWQVGAAPWRAWGLGRWAGKVQPQPWQRGTAPTAARGDSGAGVVVGQGWESSRARLGQVSRGQVHGQLEADAPRGGAGVRGHCRGIFQVNGGVRSSATG